MADYAKLDLSVKVSANSDYTEPYINPRLATIETTPDEATYYRVQVDTSDTTVELGAFATIEKIIVVNLDTTNEIMARCRIIKASVTYTANDLGFTATAPVTITDGTSVLVSSLYFRDGDYVKVENATESANDQTVLVQDAAAGTLTLAESVSQTLDAADAGTPTLTSLSENEQHLPASNGCAIFNNVQPAGDLTLIADTSACNAEVIIYGS
jgi:hypothetical protein